MNKKARTSGTTHGTKNSDDKQDTKWKIATQLYIKYLFFPFFFFFIVCIVAVVQCTDYRVRIKYTLCMKIEQRSLVSFAVNMHHHNEFWWLGVWGTCLMLTTTQFEFRFGIAFFSLFIRSVGWSVVRSFVFRVSFFFKFKVYYIECSGFIPFDFPSTILYWISQNERKKTQTQTQTHTRY